MIATIIDIVASRNVNTRYRRKLDKEIREALSQTYERFNEHCAAIPALTQGDSVELLTGSWQPIVFLFHTLLMKKLEFRVGLGTGNIVIHAENADECDGPAFWNAREALNEIRQTKYMSRPAGFRIDEKAPVDETNAVIYSILILSSLLSLSHTQLQHCFFYIWKKKRISDIAESVKTSTGNVSKSLGRTPCYLLESVLSFLNRE